MTPLKRVYRSLSTYIQPGESNTYGREWVASGEDHHIVCHPDLATALARFAVDPALVGLLDTPILYGVERSGLQWMAGYYDTWYGVPHAAITWVFADTPEEACKAALAAASAV